MFTGSDNKPTRIGIACSQELGVLFKVKERKHCPEVSPNDCEPKTVVELTLVFFPL